MKPGGEFAKAKHENIDIEYPLPSQMYPAGDYEIDFDFVIPEDAPASFYHFNSLFARRPFHVLYTFKVKMEDAMGKDILKFKTPFIIKEKPNMNVKHEIT